jgi:hypothetical protein
MLFHDECSLLDHGRFREIELSVNRKVRMISELLSLYAVKKLLPEDTPF